MNRKGRKADPNGTPTVTKRINDVGLELIHTEFDWINTIQGF